MNILVKVKGGPGSGNWGHAGRPGLVGGSGGRGAGGRRIDLRGKTAAERKDVLRDLRPTDAITLYHGMRYIDEALRTAQEGFDPHGEHERGRIYGGRELEFRGYHVSPDMNVASGFGPFVFELEAQAGDMIAPPGTHWDIPTASQADDFWRSSYPDSFRPSLSASLALAESQGLLVERVPVRSVKAVWMYDRVDSAWRQIPPQELVNQIQSGTIK